MGIYINPQDGEKEEFLSNYPQQTSVSFDDRPEGTLPVIYVDNGPFTAAGVADSARELEAFTLPSDVRPKRFYYIPVVDLLPVVNDFHAERLREQFLPKEEEQEDATVE